MSSFLEGVVLGLFVILLYAQVSPTVAAIAFVLFAAWIVIR